MYQSAASLLLRQLRLGTGTLQNVTSRVQRMYTPRRTVCFTALKDTLKRTYTPRRACLYMPGNDEKKLRKVERLDVDCVIMDCEDGVALNRKDEARTTIRSMLDALQFGRTEPIVRVNAACTELCQADLHETLSATRLPPTIMLPKLEHPDQLSWFSEKLSSALKQRSSSPTSAPLNLIVFIESALGLLRFADLCHVANSLSNQGAPFLLDGVVFGSDDFCADIGATRTRNARELMYARQHLVAVAKAYRLQAIDLVHIDFKDTEGLREQSLEGARMGFTGKQCIHPAQVPVVQEAFAPSEERIEWARELISAFSHHQQSGKGAFTFRGAMIDMPLLLQAQNIVKLTEAIGTANTS